MYRFYAALFRSYCVKKKRPYVSMAAVFDKVSHENIRSGGYKSLIRTA